jgi:hypothetical protein
VIALHLSDRDLSRRDTTAVKVAYLGQLALAARPGSRAWVRRALSVRVAETRAERHLASLIVRERHYLEAWPVPPKRKFLSYLADLDGAGGGDAGTAAMAMVALLPTNLPLIPALGLHQCQVLQLVRLWRADDLGPAIAPDLTPEVLRRIVRGERGRGELRALRDEWIARKLDERLVAIPRVLVTHADPEMGHDGGTYLGAGAVALGRGARGYLTFAWALDDEMRAALREYARAVAERAAA